MPLRIINKLSTVESASTTSELSNLRLTLSFGTDLMEQFIAEFLKTIVIPAAEVVYLTKEFHIFKELLAGITLRWFRKCLLQ